MCNKGGFAFCWVDWAGGEEAASCRAAGVLEKARLVGSDGAAVLLAKVRANEQLGQAIVVVAVLVGGM